MTVTKEQYQKYLASVSDVNEQKKALYFRAREIVAYIHKENGDSYYFDEKYVTFALSDNDDHVYTIKAEWMWDPDWKKAVDAYLEERRKVYEKQSQQYAALEATRVEKMERAELAKLLAKYPDAAKEHSAGKP